MPLFHTPGRATNAEGAAGGDFWTHHRPHEFGPDYPGSLSNDTSGIAELGGRKAVFPSIFHPLRV